MFHTLSVAMAFSLSEYIGTYFLEKKVNYFSNWLENQREHKLIDENCHNVIQKTSEGDQNDIEIINPICFMNR